VNTVAGYKLQSGSSCIDSGLTITTGVTGNPNAGGLDYWGNSVRLNPIISSDAGKNATKAFFDKAEASFSPRGHFVPTPHFVGRARID
jgi:hypothetical protein